MPYITDDMRALIGVPGPKLTTPCPLGPEDLRRFVQAVMEGNPVHWDEEAAAADREALSVLIVEGGSGAPGADLVELGRMFNRITEAHVRRMERLGLTA